jgi:hypothetical protein
VRSRAQNVRDDFRGNFAKKLGDIVVSKWMNAFKLVKKKFSVIFLLCKRIRHMDQQMKCLI